MSSKMTKPVFLSVSNGPRVVKQDHTVAVATFLDDNKRSADNVTYGDITDK